MARSRGWAVILSFAVGIMAATVFWFYRADFLGRWAPTEASQPQSAAAAGKTEPGNLQKFPRQAQGQRFQMVAEDKQVFLVDLKEGRVWRYFRHTKEEGFGKEDEGFLPIALYYGGKKHYAASEVELPPKVLEQGKKE